jgi:hypothetical protein
LTRVGRGVTCKKKTVGVAWRLDMAKFARDVDLESARIGRTVWNGSFNCTASIGWEVRPPYRLRIYYSITRFDGRKIDYDYWVDLDSTPCYYGGKRWWFICPNTKCHRRCRVLYMAPGSDYFLCRTCQNLTYRSQQEGLTRMGALCDLAINGHLMQSNILRAKTERQRQRAMNKFWRLYAKAKPLLIHGRKR